MDGQTLTTVAMAAGGIDSAGLRAALGRFATGVTVITTRTAHGTCEGITANSFSTVSLDPPLVLWSLRRASAALPGFLASKHFAVNVLASDQHEVCRHFARQMPDKLAHVAFDDGLGGCPLLRRCLATFECALETTIEGGDHIIFLGRVLRASHREGEPLIFQGGAYWTTGALRSPVPAK